ncbi:zinc finger MYM-type protein 1-like protein [Tanacetum coccineum]
MLEEKLALLRDDLKPMNTRGDMSCNAEANLNGEPSKKIANFRTLIAPAGNGAHVAIPIRSVIENAWSRFMLVRTMMNAKGIFFCKYSSTTGMEAMVEGGPWLIRNVSLILREWTHMTNVGLLDRVEEVNRRKKSYVKDEQPTVKGNIGYDGILFMDGYDPTATHTMTPTEVTSGNTTKVTEGRLLKLLVRYLRPSTRMEVNSKGEIAMWDYPVNEREQARRSLFGLGTLPNSLERHKDAVAFSENLLNQTTHIGNMLEKQSTELVTKNRIRLKASVDIVRWLVLQACAFRGNDESSNFIELLKHLASYNDELANLVLDNAPYNSKYTSGKIQKEILGIIAKEVRKRIRTEVGDS